MSAAAIWSPSSWVKNSMPWSVLKWYLTQNFSPAAFSHRYVWELYPFMCRQERGMPRSPISQVTWCADSGDRVQKSHCMSWSRRLLSARRFWERMKCWNFIGSRTKKTGVLFPTMS